MKKKRGEGSRNGANKRHYFKVAAPKDHHSLHVKEEEKSSEMAQLISMKEAEFLDSWIYNYNNFQSQSQLCVVSFMRSVHRLRHKAKEV